MEKNSYLLKGRGENLEPISDPNSYLLKGRGESSESNSDLLKSRRERMGILTEKERVERYVESANKLWGELDVIDGYNCTRCRNKGMLFRVVEVPHEGRGPTYREQSYDCPCMKIRASIRRMKRSGLESTIRRCTFDRFEASEPWQAQIKEAAMRFAKDVDKLENKWFFIGGGVGCGKTHLCTAIARELLCRGYAVRYMRWVDDSARLKSNVNSESYQTMINEFQKAEVLYIDDFFKIIRDGYGNELYPTAADLKLAYEIINYRYQNPGLITILSSERYISEIEAIDPAIGSRIYEKTKENAYNIAREPDRNYRMKGG